MSKGLTVQAGLHAMQALVSRGLGDQPLMLQYDSGRVSIGAATATPITGFHAGFDWNHGKVFASTEKQLGVAGKDLADLRTRMDALAWDVAQVRSILARDLSPDEKLIQIEQTVVKKR